jgi:hypothetical protein
LSKADVLIDLADDPNNEKPSKLMRAHVVYLGSCVHETSNRRRGKNSKFN